MSERIHIRVSLAVLLIDDFTGKLLSPSEAEASVDGAGKPVIKREGFRVFINLTEPVICVRAKGPCYCEEKRNVDLRSLNSACPVFRMRLRPSRLYPLPASAIRTEVMLPADTEVYVFSREGNDSKRLLTDYRKGCGEICLYQEDAEELEEKTCCITGKDGALEPLRLGELKQRENGLYSLSMRPSGEYRKIGTRVYPAGYLPAGARRTCFLPVKSCGKKEIVYTFLWIQGEKRTEMQQVLYAGRENRITLEGEANGNGDV